MSCFLASSQVPPFACYGEGHPLVTDRQPRSRIVAPASGEFSALGEFLVLGLGLGVEVGAGVGVAVGVEVAVAVAVGGRSRSRRGGRSSRCRRCRRWRWRWSAHLLQVPGSQQSWAILS